MKSQNMSNSIRLWCAFLLDSSSIYINQKLRGLINKENPYLQMVYHPQCLYTNSLPQYDVIIMNKLWNIGVEKNSLVFDTFKNLNRINQFFEFIKMLSGLYTAISLVYQINKLENKWISNKSFLLSVRHLWHLWLAPRNWKNLTKSREIIWNN